MPVIFVVVKNFMNRIILTIKERTIGTKSDIPPNRKRVLANSPQGKVLEPLPSVPKGHLATLISFIRNGRQNHTENASLTNEDLVLINVSDFDPRVDSYHTHIQDIEAGRR